MMTITPLRKDKLDLTDSKRLNQKGLNRGRLYMIPCPIGVQGDPYDVLPQANRQVIEKLDYFVVENLRSARRFLSKAGVGRPIDSLTFAELNEHTSAQDVEKLLTPILGGRSAGMISEAGVPGVADPGAELAALCHLHGIEVVPLVGPSSILMALMASGLNGQSFAFNGYLPIKPPDRGRAIAHFEQRARAENQSQIFIETPYRNAKLFDELINRCSPATRLCVAANITDPDELILTATISRWRTMAKPEINKCPAIFIIL